jgi:hypothetical protein
LHVYIQASGYWSHDGQLLGQGYSGHGEGVNNVNFESVSNFGPIPRGWYVLGSAIDHPHLGPVVIPIEAALGTETFGRGGFFVHGDDVHHVGEEVASHGCIILPRPVREAIATSGDIDLDVV